jgi:hypothetical protein
MADVQARVRAALRARLVASGARELADDRLFEDVDALFREALRHDGNPVGLMLPQLLTEDWQPELALRLSSHRGGLVAKLMVGIKQRVLLPLTRWLFEYTQENFRRQQRLNLTLMACLQTLAIEHARLTQEVAALRGTGSETASDTAAAAARPPEPR